LRRRLSEACRLHIIRYFGRFYTGLELGTTQDGGLVYRINPGPQRDCIYADWQASGGCDDGAPAPKF